MFDNVEAILSLSLIDICHYIAQYCEGESIAAAGNSGLAVFGQMSAIETISVINDDGINNKNNGHVCFEAYVSIFNFLN